MTKPCDGNQGILSLTFLQHIIEKETSMHFVASWDIKASDIESEEIQTALIKSLDGYSWLRLLNTFYVLEVDFEQDWNVIHERLISVAQRYAGKVNFLMSPLYEFDSDYFVYHMPESDFYKS
jgi:hypothetical protein